MTFQGITSHGTSPALFKLQLFESDNPTRDKCHSSDSRSSINDSTSSRNKTIFCQNNSNSSTTNSSSVVRKVVVLLVVSRE